MAAATGFTLTLRGVEAVATVRGGSAVLTRTLATQGEAEAGGRVVEYFTLLYLLVVLYSRYSTVHTLLVEVEYSTNFVGRTDLLVSVSVCSVSDLSCSMEQGAHTGCMYTAYWTVSLQRPQDIIFFIGLSSS